MFAFVNRQRALSELERRKGDATTYTSPLDMAAGPEVRDFLGDFYRNIIFKKRDEMKEILADNPKTVGKFYAQLVTSNLKLVTNEDFWQRYYYRCGSMERIQAELARADTNKREQRRESFSAAIQGVQTLVASVTTSPEKQEDEPVIFASRAGEGEQDDPVLIDFQKFAVEQSPAKEREERLKKKYVDAQQKGSEAKVAAKDTASVEKKPTKEKTEPSGDKEGSTTTTKMAAPASNSQDKRLAALRESREKDADLTHKQRLEELQSLDPSLWADVDIKKFRKLVHKDNQLVKEAKKQPGKTEATASTKAVSSEDSTRTGKPKIESTLVEDRTAKATADSTTTVPAKDASAAVSPGEEKKEDEAEKEATEKKEAQQTAVLEKLEKERKAQDRFMQKQKELQEAAVAEQKAKEEGEAKLAASKAEEEARLLVEQQAKEEGEAKAATLKAQKEAIALAEQKTKEEKAARALLEQKAREEAEARLAASVAEEKTRLLEEKAKKEEEAKVAASKAKEEARVLAEQTAQQKEKARLAALKEVTEGTSSSKSNGTPEVAVLATTANPLPKEDLKPMSKADAKALTEEEVGVSKSSKGANRKEMSKEILRVHAALLAVLLSVIVVVLVVAEPSWTTSLGDRLCSPLPPNQLLNMSTTTDDADVRGVAPWWVPEPYKPDMFQHVCGPDRVQTMLTWTRQKKGPHHMLTIHSLDSLDAKPIMVKKGVRQVSFSPTSLEVITKSGKTEVVQAPWVKGIRSA